MASDLLERLRNETVRLASGSSDPTGEELECLLELRDVVLRELSAVASISDNDKRLLREIGSCDPAILKRLETLKNEAAEGIRKVNQIKAQKSVYDQTYEIGSYFIDKKK